MPLPDPTVPNPTVPNPTVPNPAVPNPAAPNPAGPHPITLSPSEPLAGPKRSRLPAVAGALVAVALGAGVMVWLTRSGDDESSGSDDSSSTAASDPTEPAPDTAVAATPAPATTPATEAPPTLPSTIVPETIVPETTVPETTVPAETTPSLPVVDAPPGAIAYTDPAGWSMSIDPTWQQSPDRTAWFTGTSSAEFQDNVNVAIEELATPRSLDEYVAAAIALIGAQASDLEIIDQRRIVGADGVEVEVIGWTGSFAGLPRLSFVQAVTVTPARAYIATFTSQPDRMAGLAPTVNPFLTTIRGA